MADSLEAIINEYVTSQTDKAKKDIRKGISETNKILIHELKDMYNSFIDQFYQYVTISYVRHGTSSPGTGYGYALKRAANIYGTAGTLPHLIIDISGEYIDESYEYDDADSVLDLVMSGIRFTAGGISKGIIHPERRGQPWEWTMTWENPSFFGDYFSYSEMTIRDAFDAFDNDFHDIAYEMVRDKLREYGWR